MRDTSSIWPEFVRKGKFERGQLVDMYLCQNEKSHKQSLPTHTHKYARGPHSLKGDLLPQGQQGDLMQQDTLATIPHRRVFERVSQIPLKTSSSKQPQGTYTF